MTMIQFVSNYEDLSTDKGFQFKFYCDKCGNGYMSRFQPSYIGMAGSFLNAASNLLGWGHSAGNSAYEVQRVVGGSAHDTALQTAVEEGKEHFHQCSRCGKWVCPEVCWNEQSNQCEECSPRFEEEMASAHAHAKADAMRQQMSEKAQSANYVSNIDMSANSHVSSSQAVKPAQQKGKNSCSNCGHNVGAANFCPECGVAAKPAKPKCSRCGHKPETTVKFCPECGGKMN